MWSVQTVYIMQLLFTFKINAIVEWLHLEQLIWGRTDETVNLCRKAKGDPNLELRLPTFL